MPRYLFNPATNYTSGGGVTPVLLGGTGATTADAAATNLGFVKTSAVGAANGVASLDGASKLVANVDWTKVSSGKPTTLSGYGITDAVALSVVGSANGVASLDGTTKVPLAQMPSGLGTSITGPTSVYVNQVVNYTINNYSTFATYTITAVGGTFTRTDGTITFTTTASAGGAASITINGAVHTLTVLASSVVAPSITSPANSATDVSLVPTFTSSAFAYLGMAQTQDSVRWEISTSSGFGTTVQTYEGASNYTSWTPTSLSLNTTYYVRVKHHSSVGGWSAWSGVVSFSTIAGYGWAARLGGSSNDLFNSVACDASGNIYAVGQEISSAGNDEAYITKWDASGNITWQRKIGGASSDIFQGVATDTSGNIYAVGHENSSAGNYEALITKWDASGNLTWQRKIGGSNHDYFSGIAIDTFGNIYAVGYENSSSAGASFEAFITKWDASGNLTWQRKIGGSGNDYFYGVAINTSGNIYAVGYEYSSASNDEALITKWDASGNLTWQRKIGGTAGDIFYSVTCDASGNIYAVGYEYSSAGNNEAYITKWDASGNLTWQRKIGGTGSDRFYAVATDASGNIYAVGYENSGGGNHEALITKWDTSGNLTWQRKIGGASSDIFPGVATDTSGNIYAVGYENSSAGNYEALITKWPSDVTNLPNGALVGSGMSGLSIAAPTFVAATVTLTASTTTLTVSTTTLTASTPTITTATPTHTRYFSTF